MSFSIARMQKWFSLSREEKLTVVGFFCGKDSVSMCKLVRDPGSERLRLRACDYRHFTEPSECEDILTEWVQGYYLSGKFAAAVFSPRYYRFFLMDRPDVEDAYLPDALQWQIKELIEYPIEEAAVEAVPVSGPTEPGQQQKMVYGIVCPKKDLDEWIGRIESRDLFLESVEVPETAILYSLPYYGATEQHLVFLIIHPKLLQLVFVYHQKIYMIRHVDLDFGVAWESDAWQVGSTTDSTAPAILQDLLQEIRRSLDYAQSEYDYGPITQFYCSPLAEQAEALRAFLEQALAVSVCVIKFEDFLDCKREYSLLQQERTFLALCAALRGVER